VVLVRPIRPEDAAIEQQFVRSLSAQSRHSRFMGSQSELTPEMKERFFEARSEDAVQRRVLTGKQCRMLRSKFTEAWDAPGAPVPLPMPQQSMLVADALARIKRSRRKDYMSYYVGQIVGDMKEETSVKNVIHDMLNEFADSVARLGRQLEDREDVR